MSPYLDVMVLSLTAACWAATLYLVRSMFSDEGERLRARVRELERELEERERRLREHYERLLAEAAIRNSMMVGLWSAWKSGRLGECYRRGGEVKVLADGAVLCEMPKEKSYVVEVPRDAARGPA